ncbi:hypothetical protein WR25_00097 [Diploscapter pachys]|uniref:MRH domain-containing protein n=1 Tax=Diploscapter pachys TaxID=2018661 RepID=A0A2A2KEB7_9BILA|nr:hypothetical protein WR25_00097 [Diploscapter pachys]
MISDADEIRKEFTEINNQISNIDRQIRESEQFMEHDYGEDMAWAALKGQCYELDEMQYTYKICPFDKTVQKEKNGYGETSLGNWKEWSGGSGADKYKKQKYEDGQQCWNGPKRSTEVVIECGEETKLLEATEPAKCEYRFRMQTPAACNDPEKEPAHTEL